MKIYPLRVDLNPKRLADLLGNYEDNERNLIAVQSNFAHQCYPYNLPLVNHWIHWAHQGSFEAGPSSGAPSLVHTHVTAVKFGSFDPNFMSSVEPEPTDVGRRGKR